MEGEGAGVGEKGEAEKGWRIREMERGDRGTGRGR